MAAQELTLDSVPQALKQLLPEGASWIQPTSFQSTSGVFTGDDTRIVSGIAYVAGLEGANARTEFVLFFLLPQDDSGTPLTGVDPSSGLTAILFPTSVYVDQSGGTGGIQSWQISNFGVVPWGPTTQALLVYCHLVINGQQGATVLLSVGFQVFIGNPGSQLI
jgi:hypothetical protein